MSQYESSVKIIPFSQEKVYAKLSDLNNLESIKGQIPADKIQDLTFDADTVSVSVSPVGTISIAIVEREAPKCIKFESTKSPVPFNLWIQIVPMEEEQCKMRIVIKADINPFLKPMIEKPLKEAIEKLADALSKISY